MVYRWYIGGVYIYILYNTDKPSPKKSPYMYSSGIYINDSQEGKWVVNMALCYSHYMFHG